MLARIIKRHIWQGVFLVAILVFALLHTLDNVYPSPHSLCPFAGLATLYSLLTTGQFIHRIHSSAVFLLIAVGLTAVVAGRFFCGWLCPFGTIGEWLRKVGSKIGLNRKRITIPAALDRVLRYLKYVVLAAVLYYTWTAGELIFRGWCPWAAFMSLFAPLEIVEDILMGGLILIAIMAVSLFVDRVFCKYLCPLGAAISLFNRFSIIKPVRNTSCNSCLRCEKVCPSGIEISKLDRLDDPECLRCYQCMEACPDKRSLSFNIKRLKPHLTGLLVLLVFGSTILYSVQAGYWERGRNFVRATEPGVSQHRLSGILESVDDIKSNYSLTDISQLPGITLSDIYQKCGIPEGIAPDTTLRELKVQTGITRKQIIDSLR